MKKRKQIVIVCCLLWALLHPCGMDAQLLIDITDDELLDPSSEVVEGGGLMRRGGLGQQGMMGNQTFGLDLEENYTPVGSGVFMLIAAGIGYASLKSKKTKGNDLPTKTN